jgi:hypothetical protein
MSRRCYWEMMESIEDRAIDLSMSFHSLPLPHINCGEMGFPIDFDHQDFIEICCRLERSIDASLNFNLNLYVRGNVVV